MEKLRGEPGGNMRAKPLGNLRVEPVKKLKLRGEPVENLRAEPVENIRAKPVEKLRAKPGENLRAEPVENVTVEPVENLKAEPVEDLRVEPGQVINEGRRSAISTTTSEENEDLCLHGHQLLPSEVMVIVSHVGEVYPPGEHGGTHPDSSGSGRFPVKHRHTHS